VLILTCNVGFTQEADRKRPNVEEMHLQKFEFIVNKAHLSSDEATIVKPIFMEYENIIWKQHKQNYEIFKNNRNNKVDNIINYAELNDNYVDFEVKQAQQFKNYHLKLRKLLQPETLFKFYRAEREFKRKLLKDMQDHNQRKNRQ
jgi:diacylglycerol kinase family enzyme